MNTVLQYEFLAPGRIVFGWGRRREVGRWAATLGRRAWIVCGSRTLVREGVLEEIEADLRAESVEPIVLETLSREPEVDDVDRLAAELRRQDAGEGDLLLAVGGGSAIDLAKAAAAMATNRQSSTVRDYLEGIGRGLTLVEQPLPVLAMPTTAGAGAEATRNAVIASRDPPAKKSLRDARLMPRIALVDPELTVTAPPAITAASGMDAITQLIESYVSRKSQPIPRALAIEGLRVGLASLAEAVRQPQSRTAREGMAHAALLSGVCLANAGLGMAHGVAAALGAHCGAAHGAACAVMLPAALRVNRQARREELAELARRVLSPPRSAGIALATNEADETSALRGAGVPPAVEDAEEATDALIARIERLAGEVGAPRRLSELGVRRDQIPAVVAGSRGSSMSGNPVDLTDEQLTEVLLRVL